MNVVPGLGAADDVVGRGVDGRGRPRHDRDLVQHGGQCALVGDEERADAGVERSRRSGSLDSPRSPADPTTRRGAGSAVALSRRTTAAAASMPQGTPACCPYPRDYARGAACRDSDASACIGGRASHSGGSHARRRRPGRLLVIGEPRRSEPPGESRPTRSPCRGSERVGGLDRRGERSPPRSDPATCGSDGSPAHSVGSSGRAREQTHASIVRLGRRGRHSARERRRVSRRRGRHRAGRRRMPWHPRSRSPCACAG